MKRATRFSKRRVRAGFPSLPTLILACVCATAILCLPAPASAGLPEDIAAAFQDALNDLIGTEMEPVPIHFAYKPPDLVQPPFPPVQFDSVHVDITIIGFAFCNPPDPWGAPNPTPTIPLDAYGCQDLATVDADVVPDETSAQITVSVSDFFLDLEYQRDLTLACAELGGGTKSGEAYLLTSLTVTAGLALEHTGGCIQASIVPGSVQVVLVDKAHGFLSDDCLDLAWPLYSGPLFALANELGGEALAAVLLEQMVPINDALCEITPVQPATWGRVKSRFR